MSKKINIMGKKFHRLLVIAESEYGKSCYICQCDCGNTTVSNSWQLRSGRTKSCGCWKGENGKIQLTTHGLSKIPEYKIWKAIKSRCYNPKFAGYNNYGGRGIKVCSNWKNSFENFFSDMGNRPTSKHSIERIDNNGDYCPENCKWATRVEQGRNRRTNRMITFQNETKCLTEWVEILNLSYATVKQRLNKLNWSTDRALSTPSNPRTGKAQS